MNLNFKELPAKLLPIIGTLKRYVVIIFIVALVGILGFLVYRINSLTQLEPNEDDVTEKLQTVQRPRIDQAALDKIQQLEDQNIEVQTLFQQARDNPFSE